MPEPTLCHIDELAPDSITGLIQAYNEVVAARALRDAAEEKTKAAEAHLLLFYAVFINRG